MIDAKVIRYRLQFFRPAGTSRGTYLNRTSWFIILSDRTNPEHFGIGECAPLPALSCDDCPGYEEKLADLCKQINQSPEIFLSSVIMSGNKLDMPDYKAFNLTDFPSILTGLETASVDFLNDRNHELFSSPFTREEKGIPINGLIWMGKPDYMQKQIEQKLASGFHCIKLKIGAIDFETEFSLLKSIRKRYSSSEVELRVDANGGFSPSQALERLKRLSELDIHSIEQPIKAGQWKEMARLTGQSPLPIGLDEELIGWNHCVDKIRLLETIRPKYLILKPSLHGGFSGCEEWIRLAEERNIQWWITSALESNIGLNAIAQWAATLPNPLHQGLGTGLLFSNNIDSPLEIRGQELFFNRALKWNFNSLYHDGKLL